MDKSLAFARAPEVLAPAGPPVAPCDQAHHVRRTAIWRQFTVRTIEARHRGSCLGVRWLVLCPLLMPGLHVFAFGTAVFIWGL
jgi:hypothetical protein